MGGIVSEYYNLLMGLELVPLSLYNRALFGSTEDRCGGPSGPFAMRNCEPRQARKGATVAVTSCAEGVAGRAASIPLFPIFRSIQPLAGSDSPYFGVVRQTNVFSPGNSTKKRILCRSGLNIGVPIEENGFLVL